jgi:hypothetical protein
VDSTDYANLNNIISGALDRLHYEEDPCVKYDSERKLWIYLHKNRDLNWPDWYSPYVERQNSLENNSLKGINREEKLKSQTPQ